MATFSDQYTRKQGMMRTYEYKVKITPFKRAHVWQGTISHEGELKGSPAGQVGFRVPADVVEATARVIIESAIEELSGVVE
ncbi:MAG: hypothetical protein ABI630_04120 [Betaproteobacteria bacterium]